MATKTRENIQYLKRYHVKNQESNGTWIGNKCYDQKQNKSREKP